jgi:outer membrane protein insertion porin family
VCSSDLDGVSRGFSFSLTETDASENNTSNYLIDRISVSIDYGIPLSEYNKLGFRVGVRQNTFKTTSGSSAEVYQFLRDNSDKYNDSTPDSEIDRDDFNTVFTVVSLSKDTRNRRIFADSGHLNSVNLELQGGDLYYYKWRLRHQSAFALNDTFTYNIKGRIGFGDGYNDTDDLPIYEKFHAGGVRSVRGYDFNSLGPLDSEGDAEGGNLQVITTNEIIFPVEALGSSDTFRVGLYFDAGNVFATSGDYDTDELRQSVGISAKWLSFIGPLEFSYAFPLNDEDEDDIQEFQFALGASF